MSSRTPKKDRDAAIAGLADGSVQVLVTCDLVSEGLDVPGVDAVILMRPTQSLGLYMQQIGRGMRPAPGKSNLIVLDHVGNTLRHGLPNAPREWSLEGKPKRKHREGCECDDDDMVWTCKQCNCANSLNDLECENCGEPRAEARPQPAEVEGELAEIQQQQERNLEDLRLKRARVLAIRQLSYDAVKWGPPLTAEELEDYRLARNYKPGWRWHMQKHYRDRALGVAVPDTKPRW